MTNKKPSTRTTASVHQPTKLDAATLNNMALHTAPAVAADRAGEAALRPIIELLTKLSPSNVDLVTNIIRCILAEQKNMAP